VVQALLVEFEFVSNDGCEGVTGVAVVIDVLRAFSFAAFALDAGAERLILMDDLDETLALTSRIPGSLAGKDGRPRDGFELLNSPGQVLERTDLDGRTIVHRTSAGTIGAVAARHASHVYGGSFVVAEATVRRVLDVRPSLVTFVITGDGGRSEEDLSCAEYLRARLSGERPDPAPYLARAEAAGQRLRRAVELGYEGVHVDDVDLCLDLDRFDFALRAQDEDGLLTLRKDEAGVGRLTRPERQ
jgi:2-phosphosulfolactate phosphatase